MKFYSLNDDSPESARFWKRVGFGCLLLAAVIDAAALAYVIHIW